MKTPTQRLKTYFVGVATNWQTGRYNLFCVAHRDSIPASVKDLQSIKAANKKLAKQSYLFAQI
jgi:hypothetical protein